MRVAAKWLVGDRHPARKPDDYAKEAKIAVDKGFDAIKMNFST